MEKIPADMLPWLWKRFIDDIIMLWTHGRSSHDKLLEFINNIHPTIKFEATISDTSVNFLDTVLYFDEHMCLRTDLYIKPTDCGLLLHYKSHHPESCKVSTIYSQALRYRRIISDDNCFLKHLDSLKIKLMTRGYPRVLVERVFSQVMAFSQSDLVFKNPAYTPKVTPFVIPYCSHTKGISKILREESEIIREDKELCTIWNRPPLVAHQHTTNLKHTGPHKFQVNTLTIS